ncbi:MAG: uracil-DNA glycosylase family 4 [Planctomycetota bacterium]
MTQNETQELRELATALAGVTRRRQVTGLRRVATLAPPEPPTRQAAPIAATTPAAAPSGTTSAVNSPPLAVTAAAAVPTQQVPTQPAPAPPAPTQPQTGYTPPTPNAPPDPAPRPAGTPAAAKPAELAADAPDVGGIQTLEDLGGAAASCRACTLSRNRNRVFFSSGTGSSGVLFLDEAPDPATDSTGDPFRSPGGALLANIITKGMGLQLEDVQVACLVKCLPPGNRPAEPGELGTCRSWLNRQIELLDPKVIVTLGRPAATALLGVEAPLGRLRGQVHQLGGRAVVTTYHPEYLLRSPQDKKKTWEDIQLAMSAAGIPLPGPQ